MDSFETKMPHPKTKMTPFSPLAASRYFTEISKKNDVFALEKRPAFLKSQKQISKKIQTGSSHFRLLLIHFEPQACDTPFSPGLGQAKPPAFNIVSLAAFFCIHHLELDGQVFNFDPPAQAFAPHPLK